MINALYFSTIKVLTFANMAKGLRFFFCFYELFRLDEAIAVRKRLENLYIDTFSKDENGSLDFCKKYGHYSQYEYEEGVIDISRTLNALLKYGPTNIGDYLKE